MSNKKRVNKRRRRSPWFKMFANAETRLSARVTREEDWQTDVPNIRLSRAFIIVLIMHFVVIGAWTGFSVMNSDQPQGTVEEEKAGKVEVATKPEKKESPASAPAAAPKAVADKKPVEHSHKAEDMRRHVVHSGDSVAKIAQQYNVTAEEIYAVNRIDELYQLYQGRVLRIPASPRQPLPPNSKLFTDPRPNQNGSNMVNAEGSRTNPSAPAAEIAKPIDIKSETLRPEIDKSLVAGEAERVDTSRPVVIDQPSSETDAPREDVAIVIPREETRPAPEVEPEVPAAQAKTYKVVKGDNPFRIAQRFGIHYKELLSHNGITDPSKLQIGQTLRIPN